MKLFYPEDYLALPGCLEREEVEILPGFTVDLDLSAVKFNENTLRSFFATLPPYSGWQDFLPFVDGSPLLAKMYVLIGDRAGAWKMSTDFSILRKRKIPKPSQGDLVEEPKEDSLQAEDTASISSQSQSRRR